MNIRGLSLMLGILWVSSANAQSPLKYDFNQFGNGPIEGQFEWNVYDMVKDTSALSIMDELGTSEQAGDKALVVRASEVPVRCVTGEPVRWLPGHTLKMEFDFKIAIDPAEVTYAKPIMTAMIGNQLLSEKAGWSIVLEATPDGDWRLFGAMPDAASQKIFGENFLIRSNRKVSISRWHTFVLVVKKGSEPDSFDSSVEIRDAQTKKIIANLKFSDETSNKVAKAMWSLPRVHAGFLAPRDQCGLVCIDNLNISSFK